MPFMFDYWTEVVDIVPVRLLWPALPYLSAFTKQIDGLDSLKTLQG